MQSSDVQSVSLALSKLQTEYINVAVELSTGRDGQSVKLRITTMDPKYTEHLPALRTNLAHALKRELPKYSYRWLNNEYLMIYFPPDMKQVACDLVCSIVGIMALMCLVAAIAIGLAWNRIAPLVNM